MALRLAMAELSPVVACLAAVVGLVFLVETASVAVAMGWREKQMNSTPRPLVSAILAGIAALGHHLSGKLHTPKSLQTRNVN